jgi:hypothetical protein
VTLTEKNFSLSKSIGNLIQQAVGSDSRNYQIAAVITYRAIADLLTDPSLQTLSTFMRNEFDVRLTHAVHQVLAKYKLGAIKATELSPEGMQNIGEMLAQKIMIHIPSQAIFNTTRHLSHRNHEANAAARTTLIIGLLTEMTNTEHDFIHRAMNEISIIINDQIGNIPSAEVTTVPVDQAAPAAQSFTRLAEVVSHEPLSDTDRAAIMASSDETIANQIVAIQQ